MTTPTKDTVRGMLDALPAAMIRETAERICREKGLTDKDLCYLLANYELPQPRIIKRRLSDATSVIGSIG